MSYILFRLKLCRALAVITPPVPDVHRLRSPKGAGLVVMRAFFGDLNINKVVLANEWKLCQVDLVNLIEDLLASSSICRRHFLRKEMIELRVAIEIVITPIRRNLAASIVDGIIWIVRVRTGPFSKIVLSWLTTLEEWTKVGAGWIIGNIRFDANLRKTS